MVNKVKINNVVLERGMILNGVDLGNDVVGSEQGGFRPCVVLSNDICNMVSPTITVAPISTKIHKMRLPTHIYLPKEKYGLYEDSFIMVEQIRTIDKRRIVYFGGIFLDASDIKKLNKALKIQLGLINF